MRKNDNVPSEKGSLRMAVSDGDQRKLRVKLVWHERRAGNSCSYGRFNSRIFWDFRRRLKLQVMYNRE